MRRDQEGRQPQGLRSIFKPLKEWCGKTDESQWTTLRRLKKSVMVQQPAIRSKSRGKLRKDAILLHDNSCPCTANQTIETENELGFGLM
jgi:uncharacterized protein with NRDE domain